MPSANSQNRKKRRIVDGPLPAGEAYWNELRAIGRDAGLHSVGVAPVDPLTRAREQIEHRIAHDLVNGMQFTFRNPERSTTPSLTVENAKSIIVGAHSYFVPDEDVAPHVNTTSPVTARVARYAWVDHQEQLKASLRAIMKRLRDDGHRAVVFADDNSIVDREVAYKAGIGWFGKNANILLPSAGSYFVLGCVVTTAELPISTPVSDGCGTCTRCIPACPTNAIVAPGVIDAHRCLSWLLQKPGIFAREHRQALGDRIYGCDDCQSSCPHTQRWSVPVALHTTPRVSLDCLQLLSATDDEVLAHCDGWYIHERNPMWIRRNALIILGNTAHPDQHDVRSLLMTYLASPEPILRAHAAWAAARLGLHSFIPTDDTDEMVRNELAHLPALRDDL